MFEMARVVVVALVVVALIPVKFWRVEEAFARKLVAVTRPVEVMLPPLKIEAKRLVLLAVVAKKVVEVALVEVELSPVKFWKLLEAVAAKDGELRTFEAKVKPESEVRVSASLQYATRVEAPAPSMAPIELAEIQVLLMA